MLGGAVALYADGSESFFHLWQISDELFELFADLHCVFTNFHAQESARFWEYVGVLALVNLLLEHGDAVLHNNVAFAARSFVGRRKQHPRPSSLIE